MLPRQFLDEWQKNRRCKNLAKLKSSGSMILDKSNKKSIWMKKKLQLPLSRVLQAFQGSNFCNAICFAIFLSCAVLDISQGDTPKMNQAKRWFFANVYFSLRKT